MRTVGRGEEPAVWKVSTAMVLPPLLKLVRCALMGMAFGLSCWAWADEEAARAAPIRRLRLVIDMGLERPRRDPRDIRLKWDRIFPLADVKRSQLFSKDELYGHAQGSFGL